MAGENNFLRVPPDSTGKRVRMQHTAQVFYTGLNPPGYKWDVGEHYFVAYNDDITRSMHVHGYHELSSTSGWLEVHYNSDAVANNLSAKQGATIYDEDGITALATVSTSVEPRDVYINTTNLIGQDNPENGVDVDSTGSMNIRFAEGLPQLDAFGKLRTSGKTILGDYIFGNSALLSDFSQRKWGSGSSIAVNQNLKCLTLTTPAGTATSRNNTRDISVDHTSNTYHHYFPGVSQLAIMTVASGDSGQEGVIREWGYFDDANGYFFRVNEEQISTSGDNFEFVIRSKTSGSVKEIRMGRNYTKTFTLSGLNWVEDTTSIDGWNKDPLDGKGDSGKALDLTNDNIWWVDIQWLGAGRVRFGTYHKGQRVVVHEYYHDDNGGIPHSQSGALPLSFRQYHVLNAVVSNSSSMKVWCAAVAAEADIDLKGIGRGQLETFSTTFDPNNLNDWKGLNDIGKGDRVGVITTGVTGATTTLTVPSTTNLRAGYRLHMENDNGGGALVMGTEVVEIVDATTLIVTQAPSSPLTGVEQIRFHFYVENEYQLVGILTPRLFLDNQTGKNRTLYIPQSMQALAYHQDGSDAFCEIEVYVNPVLSGNSTVITLENTEGGPFTKIEPNDPESAVASYKNNGLVNYFGAGYHQLASYFKGATGREDLGAQYSNIQQGAFKLFSSEGGNNRCPLKRIIQSPSAGIPTVIEIDVDTVKANGGPDFSLHREGNPIQFEGILGLIGTDSTYGLNDGINSGAGKTYYLRMISQKHAELYEDNLYTTPADTSGLSNATNGNSYTWNQTAGPGSLGFIVSGYGEHLYFAIVAKPIGLSAKGNSYGSADLTPTVDSNRDITVNFRLNWNEVSQ